MRISTGGRYGLRLMLDLALYADQGPVLRQDIAARQDISAEYIAQLIRHLAKSELVESTMGPGGGYRLGRPATEIRIGDIFRATEGPIAAVFCVQPGAFESCRKVDACAAHMLWKGLSKTIEDFLDSITLEDLCLVARQLESKHGAGCQDAVDTLVLTVGDLTPLPCSDSQQTSGTTTQGAPEGNPGE
jgi:Rrf2 family protein